MHKRLLNILERLKFQLAFTLGRTGHYDVGLVGLWYGRNYGSMVSYYSLHRHLQSMGLSVLMISNPLRPRREAREFHQSPPGRLARACYQVSRQRHLGRMRELNKLCDAFIVGSDQLWNYALSRPYQLMYCGGEWFDSLADLFMLQERLVATPAEIPGHHCISSGIDYDAVAGIVDDERRRAAQWLKVAL